MELFTLFSRTGNNTGGGQLGAGGGMSNPPPPQLCLFCVAKGKPGNEGGKKAVTNVKMSLF